MNIQNALEFVEENYDVFRTLVNDFELCEESFRSIVEYDMKYDWIDSINYKKNCSAGVLSSKNINIISRNTTNNFVRLGGISSYDSINSLSQYDKFLQASKNKKKTFNNKNLLLKDFNISSNKMKKIFHILTKKK